MSVLPDTGSVRWCASASLPGRSPPLDTAFRSPAAMTHLAANPRSRVNAPGLHLQSDSEISVQPVRSRTPVLAQLFVALRGRSTYGTRCQIRLQNSLFV